MSYKGQIAPIPLGQLGLYTDEPSDKLPANSAVKANNVSLYTGALEKNGGSTRYSATVRTAPIVGVHDWWPTPTTQRLIAATSDGKIWRDAGDGTWTSNTSLPSVETQRLTFGPVPVVNASTPVKGLFYPVFNSVTATTPVTFGFTDNNGLAPTLVTPTATDVQTSVRTISALSAASVTGTVATGFLIKMNGTVGDQPTMSSSGVTLVGWYTQTFTFSTVPDAGAWTITYAGGGSTSALPFNADSTALQAALRTINGLNAVTVSGNYSAGFAINMIGVTAPTYFTIAHNLTLLGTQVVVHDLPTYSIATTYTEVAKGKTTLGTLDSSTFFVDGGAEVANANRKLFIYTGQAPIQVISGDGAQIADIAGAASDWATSYPTAGLIYQGRHIAWGNQSSPHRIYISKLGDHEDFTTTAVDGTGAATYSIFSGEGDRIVGGIVYKGTLLLFKAPFGIYQFNWNGGDISTVSNVSISKFSDSFGLASSHALVQVLDDLMGGNQSGSVFSLKATEAYGSFEAGDILSIGRIRNYIRQQFDPAAYSLMQSIYYPEKEIAYFSYRVTNTSQQNRLLALDVSKQTPRFSVETKDQPTCLALRRDTNRIQRPMYGADDGYVYLMDQGTRSVSNLAYTGEFQTPPIDFSYLDQSLASKAKMFDWIELTYTSVGTWNFYVDVFCEGIFVETLTFPQRQSAATLGSFVLDRDKLGEVGGLTKLRKAIHCTGKAISFRIWNNGLNEYFHVERLTVGFRLSGDQARSTKG